MYFEDMMLAQKDYNELKFGTNISEEKKKELSKDLALNSYNSINKMIEKVRAKNGSHEDELLYSSVDILRYIMSMLNLWDINPESVADAFSLKDIYLDMNFKLNQRTWDGQPVAIVDIDDVLAEFRIPFALFLNKKFNLSVNTESEQYFFVEDIKASPENLNPEKVFESFVNERRFRRIPVVEGAHAFLQSLREKGYWIQLLTARPKEDLKIFYDTYFWLNSSGLYFDRIDFSPEKFRWCANSEYYESNSIKFAIDDSPKHAVEYADHGISVKVPFKSYNKNVKCDNVEFYNNFTDILI